MKTKLKNTILIIIGLICFYLAFGLLTPAMPFKPGLQEMKTDRAFVYARNVASLDPSYNDIDSYMAMAEKFHGMKFKRPVCFYVMSSKLASRWYTPWLNPNIKGLAFVTGDIIYVASIKRPYPMKSYLMHELSHALLYQNASCAKKLRMHRLPWVMEGAAVAFGGPDYMGNQEFTANFSKFRVTVPDAADLPFSNPKQFSSGLLYPVYGDFSKYLIEKYGEKKYHTFLKRFIDEPDQPHILVKEIFGVDLHNLARQFIKKINYRQ